MGLEEKKKKGEREKFSLFLPLKGGGKEGRWKDFITASNSVDILIEELKKKRSKGKKLGETKQEFDEVGMVKDRRKERRHDVRLRDQSGNDPGDEKQSLQSTLDGVEKKGRRSWFGFVFFSA